jgi:hypothetical protein
MTLTEALALSALVILDASLIVYNFKLVLDLLALF